MRFQNENAVFKFLWRSVAGALKTWICALINWFETCSFYITKELPVFWNSYADEIVWCYGPFWLFANAGIANFILLKLCHWVNTMFTQGGKLIRVSFNFLQEIFCSFSSKLDVKLMEHFSLVLTGPKKGQISYIQNNEKIAEVICLPSTVTRISWHSATVLSWQSCTCKHFLFEVPLLLD